LREDLLSEFWCVPGLGERSWFIKREVQGGLFVARLELEVEPDSAKDSEEGHVHPELCARRGCFNVSSRSRSCLRAWRLSAAAGIKLEGLHARKRGSL